MPVTPHYLIALCVVGGGVVVFVRCWAFHGLNNLFIVFCGEFDPGSGRTLAACLTHASRTLKPELALVDEWRTGE